VIIPALKLRPDTGHVRRGKMANPVKGAISQLGERVIDTSKGIFSAIRDAFNRESAGNVGVLNTEIKSFPSVPEPTINNAPLIAGHNTNRTGIIESNKIGGIPMPSLFITDPKNAQSFGEISLIMDPKKLDPNMNIYPTDAYTGRQPKGDVLSSGKRVLPPRDPYYEDGSRKPNKAYTSRNVMTDMRQGEYGPAYLPATESGSQDYSGAFRAATSRPFQSIDEVKNARAQIFVEGRDAEEKVFDEFRKKFDEVKYSLMDDLTDKYKKTEIRTRRSRNEKGELIKTQEPVTRSMPMSTVNELLIALGRNDADIARTAAVSEGFVPIDDIPKLRDAVNRVGEVMQTAPTKYFEAKPNQSMPLSAFDSAIVPRDLMDDEELMQVFRDNNLPVTPYSDFVLPRSQREDVMRGMKDNLFSVGGAGTVGYGALQGVGEDDGESGS